MKHFISHLGSLQLLGERMVPRFLDTINYEKISLIFLQPCVILTKDEYKTTTMKNDLDQVNSVDMIEWHGKTRKMVSKNLIQSIVNIKKL